MSQTPLQSQMCQTLRLLLLVRSTQYLEESDVKKPKGKKPKGAAYIPCLFLPYERGSCKIMLYFHGNAEDIGAAYELLDHMR